MGMALRVMSSWSCPSKGFPRCGSCPRPLLFSLVHARSSALYGWPEQLVCPPLGGGEVCVVSVSVCLPESDLSTTRVRETLLAVL